MADIEVCRFNLQGKLYTDVLSTVAKAQLSPLVIDFAFLEIFLTISKMMHLIFWKLSCNPFYIAKVDKLILYLHIQ